MILFDSLDDLALDGFDRCVELDEAEQIGLFRQRLLVVFHCFTSKFHRAGHSAVG